ncbi:MULTISPECIES: DegT/DnrJ/EryC1/StrS family aminotransferase [Bacillaceae]|uniref:DegT/DnrJ/EryC1/StrS family aminotransferase n=1 Tax=Evansella alkalicola TaxID=745819 RepID=A0ABS6JXY4_9BACI|nr:MULTISPECIES: DegT/DnrJ/EryC1/StrS family aminotransferase [Bacillaceae]MBU9723456.1 DegT/DnrJ/EryC1/StrS family aminotransferase [Bacillus alkalicola]
MIPLSKPDLTMLERKYILEVLDTGQLSFGEKINRFENLFRQQFEMEYAVAVNSGTSALHLAVKSLGLKAGDEVLTTPYSFIASANCLLYEGVKPVFVDIDPKTLNMNTAKMEELITAKTKAILVVHVFGQPCDMDEVLRIATKYNLAIIEDACEAIGAKWKGKQVGTFGDAGIFAFYPNKQITTGEGGILITNNESIYQVAASLRNQGRNIKSTWLEHERLGYNYRMSELQAAVGVAQMERLNEILKKRKQVAERYLELLKKLKLPVKTPLISNNCEMSWFVFVVILPENIDRQKMIDDLSQQGVQSKPYFPSIHLQPSYRREFDYERGLFPVSEAMSDRTLAIPFYSNLSLNTQKNVIEALSKALRNMNKVNQNKE